MPANYQFSSDAHGTDLDYSTNGDVIVSVNLGKIVMVNGKNYIPQNGLSDMLLLRLDDDTGINIWDHQEINSECDFPTIGFQLSASNTCPDYKRGAADARRMVVKGLDDIFMSGMVYGKEVYLHDGLPEHCDYDYAQPYWDDVNGNYVPVPPHLQGSRGGDMNYVTKCVDGQVWADESNGTLPQDYEMIFRSTERNGTAETLISHTLMRAQEFPVVLQLLNQSELAHPVVLLPAELIGMCLLLENQAISITLDMIVTRTEPIMTQLQMLTL